MSGSGEGDSGDGNISGTSSDAGIGAAPMAAVAKLYRVVAASCITYT